jgi:hypothetical protein
LNRFAIESSGFDDAIDQKMYLNSEVGTNNDGGH